MKGIIIISHSEMAKGIFETSKLFVGENVKQFDYLGLEPEESPKEFFITLRKKVEELNTGSGVIILADLMGGSPCNQAMNLIGEEVDILTGVNLPMVIDLVLKRDSGMEIDYSEVIDSGKEGMVNLKDKINELSMEDEEE